MAGINFDKLRKKQENIANKNFGDRDDRMLKLEPSKEYLIRMLPPENGDPCEEFHMHYNCGIPFVCNKKHNNSFCPLCDTAIKIYKDKGASESERKVAKKLNASKRAYSQIVVRGTDGKPDKGYVWGYSSKVEEMILGIFMDADYGDITDINNGRDITIKTSAREESTGFFNITILPRPKESKLAATPEAIKKLIAECPKVSDCLLTISAEEAKKRLEHFLNPDQEQEAAATTPAPEVEEKKPEKKAAPKKAKPVVEETPDESEVGDDEEIPSDVPEDTPF